MIQEGNSRIHQKTLHLSHIIMIDKEPVLEIWFLIPISDFYMTYFNVILITEHTHKKKNV